MEKLSPHPQVPHSSPVTFKHLLRQTVDHFHEMILASKLSWKCLWDAKMAFKQTSQKGRGKCFHNSGRVFMSPEEIAQVYADDID